MALDYLVTGDTLIFRPNIIGIGWYRCFWLVSLIPVADYNQLCLIIFALATSYVLHLAAALKTLVKITSPILLICPYAVCKHYKTRHAWNKQLMSWLWISPIHQWQRPKMSSDSRDILSKKPNRPILMTCGGGASHCRSSVQLFFIQTISLCPWRHMVSVLVSIIWQVVTLNIGISSEFPHRCILICHGSSVQISYMKKLNPRCKLCNVMTLF